MTTARSKKRWILLCTGLAIFIAITVWVAAGQDDLVAGSSRSAAEHAETRAADGTEPVAPDDSTYSVLLDDLATLPDPARTHIPAYDRDLFGSGWSVGADSCNTREQVLMRDLEDVTMRTDRECKVWKGMLDPGPYTGETIHFNSVQDPQAVQIDHIVPLSLAWQMGAYAWSNDEREQFSNDKRNLLAVDGPENSSKGDLAPNEWMPKNPAFTCEYAARYVEVSAAYELAIDASARRSLQSTLTTCADSQRLD